MYFSRAAVLVIGGFLPALIQSSPLNQLQRRDGVSCGGQNDDPIPAVGDVQACIDYLNGLGGTSCGNDNHGGSHCTTMVKRGSAAISFCGVPGISRTCSQVASWAQDVLNNCKSYNTADGQYTEKDFYIPVFNSNKA